MLKNMVILIIPDLNRKVEGMTSDSRNAILLKEEKMIQEVSELIVKQECKENYDYVVFKSGPFSEKMPSRGSLGNFPSNDKEYQSVPFLNLDMVLDWATKYRLKVVGIGSSSFYTMNSLLGKLKLIVTDVGSALLSDSSSGHLVEGIWSSKTLVFDIEFYHPDSAAQILLASLNLLPEAVSPSFSAAFAGRAQASAFVMPFPEEISSPTDNPCPMPKHWFTPD